MRGEAGHAGCVSFTVFLPYFQIVIIAARVMLNVEGGNIQPNLFPRLHLKHPLALPKYNQSLISMVSVRVSPVVGVGVGVSW